MTQVVIPYGGSSGWRYRAGGAGHSPGFEDPAYDVSSWEIAALPAGIPNPVSGPACGPNTILTPWASSHNDDFLVRRELGGGIRDLTIEIVVDDNVAVWLNGNLLLDQGAGTISAGGATINVDEADLAGSNVLAIRARDRARVCAYLDVRVSYTAGGWKVGAL